eukprot:jgi/Botrbrau1/17297/Bobra.0015s0054.1
MSQSKPGMRLRKSSDIRLLRNGDALNKLDLLAKIASAVETSEKENGRKRLYPDAKAVHSTSGPWKRIRSAYAQGLDTTHQSGVTAVRHADLASARGIYSSMARTGPCQFTSSYMPGEHVETPRERAGCMAKAQNSFAFTGPSTGLQGMQFVPRRGRNAASCVSDQLNNSGARNATLRTHASLQSGRDQRSACSLRMGTQRMPDLALPSVQAEPSGKPRSLTWARPLTQHIVKELSPSDSRASSQATLLQLRVGLDVSQHHRSLPNTEDDESEPEIDIGGPPDLPACRPDPAQPMFTCLFRRPNSPLEAECCPGETRSPAELGNSVSEGSTAMHEDGSKKEPISTDAAELRQSLGRDHENSDITSETNGLALATDLAFQVAHLPAKSLVHFMKELSGRLSNDMIVKLCK